LDDGSGKALWKWGELLSVVESGYKLSSYPGNVEGELAGAGIGCRNEVATI
jgi:hypothetical protein